MLISYVILFGVMYLAQCDFEIDPIKEQWVYITFCANLAKCVMKTPAMVRQAFQEEIISYTQVSEWQVKSKVNSMLIILTSRGVQPDSSPMNSCL
jgi:hypothetical protein